MATRTKTVPDWLVVVACIVPLLGFWTYGLFDLDEGFYGAVVADMIRLGDWVTPTLNGTPWFEKPILAYWLAIPSVQAFGEAWGPRLPSVLCTLATTWALYSFAKRHMGKPVAQVAALLYSSNLLVVGIGRMMMTDAPLVLCLTLAMTTLITWRSKPAPGLGWKDWLLIGLSVGFGVLAKGPVALILFGGAFLLSSFLIPSFKGAWKSAWPFGLIVSFCVLATWYVPCYLQNGQSFVKDFLIDQNIGRFSGGDRAHSVPWWSHPIYYLAILAIAALPWIALVGRRLFAKWDFLFQAMAEENDWPLDNSHDWVRKSLWIWGLVPLCFFTISGTKLPHYILPAVAPFTLILATALVQKDRARQWAKGGVAGCAVVSVLAQAAFTWDWTSRMKEIQTLAKSSKQYGANLHLLRIGRAGESSTGTLSLDQTSHPSVLFYVELDRSRTVVETENLSDVLSAARPRVVLVQKNRITSEEQEMLKAEGFEDVTPTEGKEYELWVGK